MRWIYAEKTTCKIRSQLFPDYGLTGNCTWTETGFGEIATDLPKARFWTTFEILDNCLRMNIVLYHSLSALASAEVNFWFTRRRKRLVAKADGVAKGAG
jgi:hypothetical protein